MQKISNVLFKQENIKPNDVFICTVGYEERSRYLLNQMKNLISNENILVLFFEDLKGTNEIIAYIEEKRALSIKTVEVRYEQGEDVADIIISFLTGLQDVTGNVYVDYSAMPRSWYSKLPVKMSRKLSSEVFFLYVVGEYPCDYKAYPSAGIDSYSIIGRPSLRDKKRLHVIGIGYDSVRTEALLSILDPDMYAVCSAHFSKDDEMELKVREVNRQVLEQAVSSVSLSTDDFSFLVARLCEIANEYLPLGDVVFVPDGPKPLIMAMALVPQLIKKEGVVCMHVSRNLDCYEPMDVRPTDNVLCFGFKDSDIQS